MKWVSQNESIEVLHEEIEDTKRIKWKFYDQKIE